MLEQIPDLKSKALAERLTVPMEPELKEAIMKLKQVHKKDHLEWIRSVLRREIRQLCI